jgi:hypothetical protein
MHASCPLALERLTLQAFTLQLILPCGCLDASHGCWLSIVMHVVHYRRIASRECCGGPRQCLCISLELLCNQCPRKTPTPPAGYALLPMLRISQQLQQGLMIASFLPRVPAPHLQCICCYLVGQANAPALLLQVDD